MSHDVPVRVHGSPVGYTNGSTLNVESSNGVVRLVVRDADGEVLRGSEVAPSEAHRLGQALIEASFHAHSDPPS